MDLGYLESSVLNACRVQRGEQIDVGDRVRVKSFGKKGYEGTVVAIRVTEAAKERRDPSLLDCVIEDDDGQCHGAYRFSLERVD